MLVPILLILFLKEVGTVGTLSEFNYLDPAQSPAQNSLSPAQLKEGFRPGFVGRRVDFSDLERLFMTQWVDVGFEHGRCIALETL